MENVIKISYNNDHITIDVDYSKIETFKMLLFTLLSGSVNDLIFETICEKLDMAKKSKKDIEEIKNLYNIIEATRKNNLKDNDSNKPIVLPSCFI